MEPFTLSLIGLACLILIIILTVLGTLVYSGLFESVVVASGNPPIGKATIAYIHGKGAYKEIGQVFTRLSTYLPANKEFKMLGIYYDDPDKTPTHLQRYVVAAILAEDEEKSDISLEETLLQKGCKIGVVPQVDHAVITSFPYTTFISIYLSVWKCYPKLEDYCTSKNLCAHPWMEVYADNRIKFFAPLSRQHDFYLEPFAPNQ